MKGTADAGRPSCCNLWQGNFGWPALKQGVGEYLELQGVPTAQAERFSQQIIAQCADNAESIGFDHMDQRVQSEAQTLLEGWQAARRTARQGVIG